MPTLRGSASDLVQCRVSSRSTKLVQVRASCRRYDFRAGLRASLANCVRSDARRRQSRSSLSNCSDFDIAHRLESSMRSVARYCVSCRWPTPHTKTKRRPCEDTTTHRVVEYACKEKAPRRSGAFPKGSRLRLRRFGGGAIQPGSIFGMYGNLTQRSSERVVHPPGQHAEVHFDGRPSSSPISNISNREFDLLERIIGASQSAQNGRLLVALPWKNEGTERFITLPWAGT
jgi:hypothetical protein